MTVFINTALMRALAAAAGLRARLREERGQDLIEYAVLASLIAIVAAGALLFLATSGALDSMASAIAECVDFDDVCP